MKLYSNLKIIVYFVQKEACVQLFVSCGNLCGFNVKAHRFITGYCL